jgi:hypothetical protein
MTVSSFSQVKIIITWSQIIITSSTNRALYVTDLLSMLTVITKFLKYSRKIYAAVFDIGDPIVNPFNGL